LDAHGEDFGKGRLDGIAGTVVHELRHRARSDRTDVARLISEGIQKHFVLVEARLVAADPDSEPARARPGRATTHRRIEEMAALLRVERGELPHHTWRVGREVEHRRAGL